MDMTAEADCIMLTRMVRPASENPLLIFDQYDTVFSLHWVNGVMSVSCLYCIIELLGDGGIQMDGQPPNPKYV